MRARVGAAHATDPFSTADGAIRSDAVRCGVRPYRPVPVLASALVPGREGCAQENVEVVDFPPSGSRRIYLCKM